jgi:acyl-CoA synthetase (AMP-forming)/AMP-acid ligase II
MKYFSIIILRGRNFDPALIENSLDELPFIRKGCAVASSSYNHEKGEEELFLVAEWNHTPNQEELELWKRQMAEQARSFHQINVTQTNVVAPGTIPRTSSGKIRRQETRRLILSGDLSPPKEAGMGLVLKEVVSGLLKHGKARFGRGKGFHT